MERRRRGDIRADVYEPGRNLREMDVNSAWKWAYDCVVLNGIGSIITQGKVWRLEEIEEKASVRAIRRDILSRIIDSPKATRTQMDTLSKSDEEKICQTSSEKWVKVEEELDENLRIFTWNDYHHREKKELSWAEIKTRIEKCSAESGLALLRDWTDQDLQRAEKSGIRELIEFPCWIEVMEKTLKKRLRKDKAGFKELWKNFQEVSPPGLIPRKGWKFMGKFMRFTPIQIFPLPNNFRMAWEETPRGGQ
jgi:hypothetical protein